MYKVKIVYADNEVLSTRNIFEITLNKMEVKT